MSAHVSSGFEREKDASLLLSMSECVVRVIVNSDRVFFSDDSLLKNSFLPQKVTSCFFVFRFLQSNLTVSTMLRVLIRLYSAMKIREKSVRTNTDAMRQHAEPRRPFREQIIIVAPRPEASRPFLLPFRNGGSFEEEDIRALAIYGRGKHKLTQSKNFPPRSGEKCGEDDDYVHEKQSK